MTLILATLSRQYAIQVSDRRTTSTRGIESEQVTKALSLTCEDGRFAIGYTGLAEAGTFKTRSWITELLKQCGPPDFTARGIVTRFVDKATRDFSQLTVLKRLPLRDRRLTLMLTGFVLTEAGTVPSCLFISNFQDFETTVDSEEAWPEFRYLSAVPTSNAVSVSNVQRIGAYREINQAEWAPLKALVASGVPPNGLVKKMVQMIGEASSRPSSGGTVGRNALSCVIPADVAMPITSAFYSAEIGHTVYMADAVVVTRQTVASWSDLKFAAVDPESTRPLVVPIQRRNALCACLSGKKYKHCHGK